MRYNLIVTSFSKNRAKMIIARQLAHDPSVSLQKALIVVEKPPFVLLKNITSQELKYQSEQLNRLGVRFKTEEIESNESTTVQAIPIPLSDGDFDIKPAQSVPSAPKSVVHTPVIMNKTAPLLLTDAPPKRKKHLIISTVVTSFVLALVISGLIASGKQRQYLIKRTEKVLIAHNGSDTKQKRSEYSAIRKGNKYSRENISPRAKKESIMWVDSAKIYDSDYLKAINFYKIAISFNRYNIHAWFGLLNTYRSAGMYKDVKQTRDEMKRLFGDSIFSISETVKEFGELVEAYTTDDNTFRLEYKTDQTGEKSILSETYKLTKVVREICNCRSISLFASTAPGKGMIVHVNSNASLLTLEAFRYEATIRFLQ